MKYNKIWNIKQSQIDEELKAACSGNSVLAVLLKNRGIDTKEKVYAFLHPLKTALLPPEVFTDMEKASQRIKYSIDNKENITIYGDFDADGITSTALLYLTLKQLGANVNYYVPDRAAESHGMNTKALVNIISKRKAKLIITVDCGISNYNEVNFANGFKTDVIITDHHEAPELLPAAYAIINPKAPDSLDSALSVDNIQSLNALAGAGVAFKLACKLLEMYNQKDFVHNILPLAAIGTIGDIVDLTGENRIITAMGLELLKSGKNKGAARLLTESGFTDLSSITSEIITYSVVPKINAAGRLESPITALNLLISDDDEVINTSVKTLNDLNSLRQELCEETFNQAKKLYEENISEHKKSIILFSDDWHIGIIGIVCSKLVESYNKPAFLMTRDSNNSNIIRCSCRSIEGINIHAVLSEHKDLFEGFGGHKMAAGFSFDENKIKFENFKKLLSKTIDDNSQNIDFSKITLNADMELSLEDINFENIEAIEKMQPFGTANPAPVFVMNDLKLNQYKFMGQNSNHLKLFLSKNDALILECIKWNCSDFSMPVNTALDIMFSMRLNIFNDKKSIQLILSDIRSEYLNVLKQNSEIKILDHRNKKDILNQVIDFISSTKKTTGIYINNPAVKMKLNIPETINSKIFTADNIPSDTEQIMFFDIPVSFELFSKIIKITNAKIIHLMNFLPSEITTDSFILKLSGMLKYALSNLNGIVNIQRASKALSVDEDTIDCALNLFWDSEMIDLERKDDENYVISYLHPVELSKIKNTGVYTDLETHINSINAFKTFYLNSPVEEIKSYAIC